MTSHPGKVEQPRPVAEPGAAPDPGRRLPPIMRALRPVEWSKNVFVLAPLLFSGRAGDLTADRRVALTFVAFCAAASAGYLVNDLRDRQVDAQHPRKKHRAIAAGQVTPRLALVSAAGLVVIAAGASAGAGLHPLLYTLGYLAVSIAYSVVLKAVVIVDVMTIGGCFLLRTLAGASATGVVASDWIIVCTSSVALLLGFTKRRQEASAPALHSASARPVLDHYSLPFLDQVVPLMAGTTVLAYLLYTLNSPQIGNRMLPTAAPVLYGVLRYEWLIYHQSDSRDASALVVRDWGMLAAGVTWAVLAGVLLYV